MAIAGIEGLAQGFMQGMAIKRQNDRQDVLDAQNLERFGMDKERFATQQAASAFELQNAQTNAANAATDRARTLAIQANSDATLANMRKLWSLGDNAEAIHGEVEKLHQANGEQGAYKRDAAGKIITNKSGVATWVNKDGSERGVNAKDAKMSYWMAANPNEAAKNQLENDNTIAKEERAAKTAKEKDERDYQQAISLENVRARNAITELERKGALKAPKDYLSKLSQQSFFEVQETIDPTTKEKKLSKPIFNQAKYDQFTLFAHQYNINPDDTAYRLWRKYVNEGSPQAATTTSGTDTYKSKSQGDLTVTGGLDPEVDAVDVSGIAPVSVEKPSAVKASTAKPSAPKGLTVPRPSSSSTPVKPTGNAGTMSPTDYVRSIGGAISDAMPVMPPPKQYPKDARFFGNETNPLDNPKRSGSR